MTESVVDIDICYIMKTRNLCKIENVVDGSGITLKNQPYLPD